MHIVLIFFKFPRLIGSCKHGYTEPSGFMPKRLCPALQNRFPSEEIELHIPDEKVFLTVDSFDLFMDQYALGDGYKTLYDRAQENREITSREQAAKEKAEAEAKGRVYVDKRAKIREEERKDLQENPQVWDFFATADWKKLEVVSDRL